MTPERLAELRRKAELGLPSSQVVAWVDYPLEQSSDVILELLDNFERSQYRIERLNARLAAAEVVCEMVEDDIDIFALPARYGLMRTVWTELKAQSEETP